MEDTCGKPENTRQSATSLFLAQEAEAVSGDGGPWQRLLQLQ